MKSFAFSLLNKVWIYFLLLISGSINAQVADLTIVKNGPNSANNGETITYTLTITNSGPNAANGATFLDLLPVGLTNIDATCTSAIIGATCPTSISKTAPNVSGTIPALPANGQVFIQITARTPVSGTASSIRNSATVAPPSGVIDNVPGSNESFINTALTYRTMDISVTKVVSTTGFVLGTPISYTVTFYNLGPGPADGVFIRDDVSRFISGSGFGTATIRLNVSNASCTSFSGAVCPTFAPPATMDVGISPAINFASLFTTSVPSFPSNSSIQFVVTLTPSSYLGSCGYSQLTLRNTPARAGSLAGVVDTNAANDSTQVNTPGGSDMPACPAGNGGTVKTVLPAGTITFGQTLTYSVVYTNGGPSALDGAKIEDGLIVNTTGLGLNPGIVVAPQNFSCQSSPDTSCPSLSMLPGSIVGNTTWTQAWSNIVNTWPAGGVITITHSVIPTSYQPGNCGYITLTLNNRSTLTLPSGILDPDSSNNTSGISLPGPTRVPCIEADISVNKTLVSGFIGNGQTLTYLLTYTNLGPSTATNIPISDKIIQPNIVGAGVGSGNSALTLAQISVGSCSVSGSGACPLSFSTPPVLQTGPVALQLLSTATIPTLAPGSSVSFPVSFVAASVDSSCARARAYYENSAYVHTATDYVDPNPSNNTSTHTLTYSCHDISTLKSVTPTVVPAGNTMTFTFDITNAGPGTATNVLFSDLLPSGFTYISSSCQVLTGTAVCGPIAHTASPSQVSGTVTSMVDKAAVRYTIVGAASPSPGSWTNKGSIKPGTGGIDPNPNSDSSAITFTVTSDLPSISKATTRANSFPGGTTAYTITISNPATGLPMTNMSVSDFLPSGWTYVTTTGVTTNNGATRVTIVNPASGVSNPSWGTFDLPSNGSSVLISFVANIPSTQTCGQVVSNVANATFTRGGGTQSISYDGTDTGLTSDDVTINCPSIGAAKRIVSLQDNGNTSYDVTYGIRFKNSGSESLSSVTVTDALSATAGGTFGTNTTTFPLPSAHYFLAAAPVSIGVCSGITPNGLFNGDTVTRIASGTLSAGQECEYQFTVRFNPGASRTYTNQFTVTAVGVASGLPASDVSDNGINPDPGNNNGTGGTNDPTVFSVTPTVALAITKTNGVNSVISTNTTVYVITVGNDGPGGVANAILRDIPSAGLSCTAVSCAVTFGSASCPAIGGAGGQLSIANLLGAGVAIPKLDKDSRLAFNLTCTVTASGI